MKGEKEKRMKLDFVKMDGCGNDFIMIDDWDRTLSLTPVEVQRLCDRHFGIGADGVICAQRPLDDDCDAFMNYINADGTFAQMCGNGVRCFAKFLIDEGFSSRHGMRQPDGGSHRSAEEPSLRLFAGTRAGRKELVCFLGERGAVSSVTVNMGIPVLEPEKIPVRAEIDATASDGTLYVGDLAIDSPWGMLRFCCVSFGNPHAVAFADTWEALSDDAFSDPADRSLDTLNVDMVGEFFESHPLFPEKTNVEFAQIEDDGIHMRVFERGCRETLACGTGACATLVAAVLQNFSLRENDVVLRGGRLHIAWTGEGSVKMTGPAEANYRGTVEIGDGRIAETA